MADTKKTSFLVIDFKDPDGVHEVCAELKVSSKLRDNYFEFAEYGTVELELDQKLQVVRAKLVARK